MPLEFDKMPELFDLLWENWLKAWECKNKIKKKTCISKNIS